MLGLLAALTLSGANPTSSTAIDVETLVAEALAAHPSVAAAEAQAAAASTLVSAAGTAPDPKLSVAVVNLPYDPLSLNATPMSGVRIGVMQRFLWPGKLALAEQAAALRAQFADEHADEARLQLATAIRFTYYDVHLIDVTIQVLEANLVLFSSLIEAVDAKYRVGRGLQQDILKTRISRDQLKERLLSAQRQRHVLAVRLNNLLGRNEDHPIDSLAHAPISQLKAELDIDARLKNAAQTRPLLRQLAAKLEAERSERALADKAAYPDLGVGLSYTFRTDAGGRDPAGGADFLSLDLSVDLPVFYANKQKPRAESARLTAEATESMVRNAQLTIRGEVRAALEAIPRLEAQMALYRTSIIPTTRLTLEVDRRAYQVDRVELTDLLDTEMKLITYEVDFHRLHVEKEKHIIRLAAALGLSPMEIANRAHHHHGGTP